MAADPAAAVDRQDDRERPLALGIGDVGQQARPVDAAVDHVLLDDDLGRLSLGGRCQAQQRSRDRERRIEPGNSWKHLAVISLEERCPADHHRVPPQRSQRAAISRMRLAMASARILFIGR